MKLTFGQILHEKYRLERRIGKGGFSLVWLATDLSLEGEGRQYAIKIYAPEQGLNQDDIALFANEYRRLQQLSHPNIIETHDYFAVEESPCLVLTYCPQGSLFEKIKKEGKQDAALIARLMADIGGALDYLHTLPVPIYHLDLKPDNILIAENGGFILTDFGISDEIRSTLLRGSALRGETFNYRSPERVLGKSLNEKHDVFSFGVVLLECCRGMLDRQYSVADAVVKALPLLEAEGYPVRLQEWLDAVFSLEPEDRPSAGDLAETGAYFLAQKAWKKVPEPERNTRIYRKTERIPSGNPVFSNPAVYQQPTQSEGLGAVAKALIIIFIAAVVLFVGWLVWFLLQNETVPETGSPTVPLSESEIRCRSLVQDGNVYYAKRWYKTANGLYSQAVSAGCEGKDTLEEKVAMSVGCMRMVEAADRLFAAKKYKSAEQQYKAYEAGDCPPDSARHVQFRLERLPDLIENRAKMKEIREGVENRE